MAAYYDSFTKIPGYDAEMWNRSAPFGWEGPGWYDVSTEGGSATGTVIKAAAPFTAEQATTPQQLLQARSRPNLGNFQDLSAAGMWNLADPNSQTWQWLKDTYGQPPDARPGTGPNDFISPITPYGGTAGPSQMATLAEALATMNNLQPLSPDEWRSALQGLSPQQMQELQNHFDVIQTRIASKPEQNKTLLSKIATNPLTYILPAVGGIIGAAGGAGAGGASTGATAAETVGASELGAASGFDSFVGPATGTVEAAPVIGAAGAPTVSAIASGSGPFIPTTFGTGAATGLSKLLSPSTATAGASALDLIGRAAPGIIGALAADRQASSLQGLNQQLLGFGAPSRARFESSFSPGFSMANEPGYKDALDLATKSFLHKASIGGNPADSPNAWMQTLKDVNANFALPQLNEYRRLNAGTGGLANLTSAAPGAAASAIDAKANVFNALGGAAADVFNPVKRFRLSDLLREAA